MGRNRSLGKLLPEVVRCRRPKSKHIKLEVGGAADMPCSPQAFYEKTLSQTLRPFTVGFMPSSCIASKASFKE
jgi:hypothetical protein